MAGLLFPNDLDLVRLLRRLLLKMGQQEMLAFPSFRHQTASLPRSESQMSDISDYLDIERSKSLNSSLRKCSRTEGEKKVVSFADSMGLDLCQVKPIFPYTASDEDMISNTPPSASNLANLVKTLQPTPSTTGSLNCPRYLQLIGPTATVWRDPIVVQREIHSKARLNGVALKSSSVMGMTFSGVVAVADIVFEKKISIRYTIDEWRSFVDARCNYLSSISTEGLDLFSFSIYLPSSMPVGAKCHFCIRYESGNQILWDNNEGSNYVLEVRSLGAAFAEKALDQPVFY